MLVRVMTGIVSLALFFAVLFFDSTVFNTIVCILIAGMLFEVYKATKPGIPLIIAGYISAASIVAGSFFGGIWPACMISVMVYAIICISLHGYKNYTDVLSSSFLTWYIVLFMSVLCRIRSEFDIYGVIMVCLCAWVTDTFAYFSGKLFGKHKLIPRVSPKKTVEGSVGGIISAAIFSVVYAYILSQLNVITPDVKSYVLFAVLGTVSSVLSQAGDLFASAIKRDCNIKDFGTIFPGHGGILDRFDSVVFIVPFVYYFMSYFDLMRL